MCCGKTYQMLRQFYLCLISCCTTCSRQKVSLSASFFRQETRRGRVIHTFQIDRSLTHCLLPPTGDAFWCRLYFKRNDRAGKRTFLSQNEEHPIRLYSEGLTPPTDLNYTHRKVSVEKRRQICQQRTWDKRNIHRRTVLFYSFQFFLLVVLSTILAS